MLLTYHITIFHIMIYLVYTNKGRLEWFNSWQYQKSSVIYNRGVEFRDFKAFLLFYCCELNS